MRALQSEMGAQEGSKDKGRDARAENQSLGELKEQAVDNVADQESAQGETMVLPSSKDTGAVVSATQRELAEVEEDGEASQVHVRPEAVDIVTGRRGTIATPEIERARRDFDLVIRKVLVAGLILSVTLLFIGVGIDLFMRRELPETIPSPVEALRRALALRPSGFLALGLIVLIATPIVRVIGSVLIFLYERNWRYAAITALVLMVMVVSVLVGAG